MLNEAFAALYLIGFIACTYAYLLYLQGILDEG